MIECGGRALTQTLVVARSGLCLSKPQLKGLNEIFRGRMYVNDASSRSVLYDEVLPC